MGAPCLQNMSTDVIRKTSSICPICMDEVDAFVVKKDGAAYLEKTCPRHGKFSILISENAREYQELNDSYFGAVPERLPQREYYLHVTEKCNMACPMCFLDFNKNTRELTPEGIKKIAGTGTIKRFTFSHSEATTCDRLFGLIKALKSAKKIVNIHTNGIKLADEHYVLLLKKAGIDHVSLQFDGFDDAVYEQLRNGRWLTVKLKALQNLKKSSIPVSLNVTVARGINENEIGKIFDYSIREHFIKDISFITYSNYDSLRDRMDRYIMPDELLKFLEAHSQGRISRRNILLFQKLFYAYVALFKKRKCFYYYHFLVARSRNGYRTIDELIDLQRVCHKLDEIKRRKLKLGYFSFFLMLISALRLKKIFFFFPAIPLLFKGGFPSRPSRFLALTFATICDPYKYDAQIAQNCGQGIFALDDEHESYGTFLMQYIKRKKS